MGAVNHPQHYNQHPSGVECVDIVEYFNFNIGSAIKYLWRAGLKGERLKDLEKAIWYVQREVERLTHQRRGITMPSVEWMNEKAQAAKDRDDYECFTYWRRAYLNAQAAQRRERRTGVESKFHGREVSHQVPGD